MALPDHLKQLAARVSNTGRWGDDDRRGTLNLIDTAAVLRGVAAARQGRTFSLAIPFDENGPQTGAIPGRHNPRREMVGVNVAYTGDPSDFCTSDDKLTMGVQAATHWAARDILERLGARPVARRGGAESGHGMRSYRHRRAGCRTAARRRNGASIPSLSREAERWRITNFPACRRGRRTEARLCTTEAWRSGGRCASISLLAEQTNYSNFRRQTSRTSVLYSVGPPACGARQRDCHAG
jgi:hypothetical protein